MRKLEEIYLCDPYGDYVKFRINRLPVFTERDFFLIDAHLPGVIISEKFHKKRACIMTIELFPSLVQSIKKNGKTIQLFDQINLEIPIYVFHLLYPIFHTHWLDNDIYSVHSACVLRNGYAILLMGHSGVGKTSISLNLLKKYGFKLVCSDRTLLKLGNDGRLIPIGGTKVVTYKKSNANISSGMLMAGVKYVDREVKKVIPKYLAPQYPPKINSIAMVRLSNFSSEIENFLPFEALVALYPCFLDYWNSDALLFEGLEIYNGTKINVQIKRKVLAGLRKSILKTPVVSISGSLENISRKIDKLAK